MKKPHFWILIFTYFLTRTWGVYSFPLFGDEVLYIRWIQEIQDGYLMRPLDNGRQPFFIWIATFFNVLLNNEIFALRLTSLISGFLALIGIRLLTLTLFKNEKIAFLASFIYVILPFTLIHDSIGILDSMVAAIAIYSLVLAIRVLNKQKFKDSIYLGILMGIGLITKSNAIFNLLLLPIVLTLQIKSLSLTKRNLGLTFKNLSLFLNSIVIAKISELIIVLHPIYFRILAANGIFIHPLKVWITLTFFQKFDIFFNNFQILSTWIIQHYLTLLFLLVLLPIFLKKHRKEIFLSITYFVVPFFLLCIFGRVLFPRYLLPMTIFLIPLMGYISFNILAVLRSNYVKLCFILMIFVLPIYSSINLFGNYTYSFIPQVDKNQYFGNGEFYNWLKKTGFEFRNVPNDRNLNILLDSESLAHRSFFEYTFHNIQNIKLTYQQNDFISKLNKSDQSYVLSTNSHLSLRNIKLIKISAFAKGLEEFYLYKVVKKHPL